MRPIARGGMGEVYLARDSRLGRRVALKIIRTELEGSDDATQGLLFEAQTIARFSHPNIVTVFAVGEFRGRPYLALEYLEGVNLEERLAERRLASSEGLRIAAAVADAVAEAHEHGVLHLDLKPANVIIPRDGRVRVLDFGLARIVRNIAGGGSEGGMSEAWGSPAYTAPELWLRQEATGATDVWSLGVLLYQMLSGKLPWQHDDVVELGRAICAQTAAPRLRSSAQVDELVARCLAKDPRDRPSATAVRDALAGLLDVPTETSAEESPFRGLLPFTSRHARLFFGREDEIAAFAERARHHGVLPIVGPSGSGKTSFVQAGVIPRLREQGDWLVLRMHPGSAPFEALVDRIRVRDAPVAALQSEDDDDAAQSMTGAVLDEETAKPVRGPGLTFTDAPADVAEQLRESPRRVGLLLRRLADESGRNVLLVVEQLEELLTMVPDAATRHAFVVALCTAADDASEPVRVVFTVRDEVLGRIASGPDVQDAFANMTVLQPLSGRALRRVIVAPVEAMGYRYEDDAVVDHMSDVVHGEPGSLALLQFAALKLWELRDTDQRLLMTTTYEMMGGVEGALARHADGVVDSLADAERRIARRLLVRLATPTGGRQAATIGKVTEGLGDVASEVLRRLAQARLVTVTRGRDVAGPRVELGHSSLITHWSTLVQWVEEARGDGLFLADAGQAAELWERRGRRPEELWVGDALVEANRRQARLRSEPPPLVSEFLAAAAHRQRRRTRRIRISRISVVAVSLGIAVAGSVASVMIANREHDAVVARDQAQHQRAVALREAANAAAAAGQLLEARAKLRVAFTEEDAPPSRALWRDLRDDARQWDHQFSSLVQDVAFAPDGSAIAVGCQDMTIYVLDVVTRKVTPLRGSTDQVSQVAWAPDSRGLVSGSWNGELTFWDLATHKQVRTVAAHDVQVRGLAYSANGRWVASASDDERVRLWNPQTGEAGPDFEVGARPTALAFSPDGSRIVAATSDGLRLWRVDSGEPARHLGEGPAMTATFSRDGRSVAGGFTDAAARVWDVQSEALVATVLGHASGVTGAFFDSSGERLITASSDKTVRTWRVSNQEQLSIRQAHEAGVVSVDFDLGSDAVATAGRDRVLRLWNLKRRPLGNDERGHASGVYRTVFGPQGHTVASASGDHSVRLWDVATGAQLGVLRGHDDGVDSVAISPGGTLLASGSQDTTVRLWDVESATVHKVLSGHTERVWDVKFSVDGERLASAGRDGDIRIWDVASGLEVGRVDAHEGAVYGVAFGPQNTLASAGADGAVRIWGGPEWTLRRSLAGHRGSTYGVAYGPNGRWLASSGADGEVRVWELGSDRTRVLSPHVGRVYWLDVTGDGERVAAPTSSGEVVVWSIGEAPNRVVLRGHRDEANAAAFSADGSLIATGADDGTVRLWEAATGRPFWRAPLLSLDPPTLYSHEGWTALTPAAVAEPPSNEAWRMAVEQDVRLGVTGPQGRACVATHSGSVELWSSTEGTKVAAAEESGVLDLRTAADGCLVRTQGAAIWLSEGGGVETVDAGGPIAAVDVASGESGTRIFAVTDHTLVTLRPDGGERVVAEVGVGVTAVGHAPNGAVLGFQDGTLRHLPAETDVRDGLLLGGGPASAVERVVVGPEGIVAAGFANGAVGMWSLHDGSRLALGELHGRVVHLAFDKTSLYAVSDLGHALRWGLDVLVDDYCEVLREVWERVPVVWSDGAVVVQDPPADHRCAR